MSCQATQFDACDYIERELQRIDPLALQTDSQFTGYMKLMDCQRDCFAEARRHQEVCKKLESPTACNKQKVCSWDKPTTLETTGLE